MADPNFKFKIEIKRFERNKRFDCSGQGIKKLMRFLKNRLN